ncbi:hypothetical protein BBP40_000392 [Aspergillus hancockii]|nr:hypothetical protein BBP40_000392 [Aspergillus hancockii]
MQVIYAKVARYGAKYMLRDLTRGYMALLHWMERTAADEVLVSPHWFCENGEELSCHTHRDHVGRPSLVPESTSLVVGPGLKKPIFPGYPVVRDAPVLAREFEEREVKELGVDQFNLEIGSLKALDYFNDGSFLSPFRACSRTSQCSCPQH